MKKFTKMLLLALVFIGVSSSLTACGSTEDKLLGVWKIKHDEYFMLTDIKDEHIKGYKKALLNNSESIKSNYKDAKKQRDSRRAVYKIKDNMLIIRNVNDDGTLDNNFGYNIKGLKIRDGKMKVKIKGYFLHSDAYRGGYNSDEIKKISDLEK